MAETGTDELAGMVRELADTVANLNKRIGELEGKIKTETKSTESAVTET